MSMPVGIARRDSVLRLVFRTILLAGGVSAAFALLLLALAPIGFRLGWWDYRFALLQMIPWAGYCGLIAAVAAALALAGGGSRRLAVAATVLLIGGAVAYVPWHYYAMRGVVPSINDITTDPDNPPAFVAAAAIRKAAGQNTTEYGGPKVAAQQRRAYPDIAPLILKLAPNAAFDRALAAAKGLGWTITATDPEAGHIEASDRTRWFGFTDDIVIRVTADSSGSRIDVRSSSRVGRGDFGVNARRIRKYLATLRAG